MMNSDEETELYHFFPLGEVCDESGLSWWLVDFFFFLFLFLHHISVGLVCTEAD